MDSIVGKSIKLILAAIGEEPEREGLWNTPARVERMYSEIFGGYSQTPESILATTFTADKYNDMVLVRNIEFYSHCEHHMVPFFGKANVAYIPNKKVVGLSKIVRLVECFAHRLQIQERLTTQIADSMIEQLDPLGVMVVIEAEHLCMKMRGVKSPCADTVTSAVRGNFLTQPETRAEFLSLIRR